MSAFEPSGDVSKRVSLEERRVTEKPNGVVLWSVKTKSEVASERKWFSGRERL